MPLNYMPISVRMDGRSCLVVGGGPVAVRKVENLMDYESTITVVAPVVDEKLEYHAKQGRITLEKRKYRTPEAGKYGLVICATDDTALNLRVYEDARANGVMVNVADDPSHCDFIFPAVLRRDCLTAAIATDGKAPFMAGHLRVVLDHVFPEHWDRLMKLAASFRTMVRERWGDDSTKKSACYAEFLEADWKKILKDMDDGQIADELARMLDPTG